jgi:hypothetical protein
MRTTASGSVMGMLLAWLAGKLVELFSPVWRSMASASSPT